MTAGKFRALGPLVDSESLGRTDIVATRALYDQVRRALERNNPDNDFVFSLCLWGSADVRSWAKDLGNMSRTSDDIAPTWGRMLHSFDSASHRPLYAHPGSWNDPDMLYVGAGDFGADHLVAARAHFAMWAMINAPLMIGYDLRSAPANLLKIFGNARIIGVNQDRAGNQAVLAFDSNDVQILVKTLASGEKAVALVNRTSAPLDADLTAAHLKFRPDTDIELTDLWTGAPIKFRGEHKFTLEGRQTLIFTARGARKLPDGLYLSEMPGAINPAVDGVVVPEADPIVYRPIFWASTHGNGEPPRYGGWGGAQADSTPYNQTLRIKDHRYETGIGVLANSRLEVRNAGYTRFEADVGIDASARDLTQAVTFSVFGDGKLLMKSRVVRPGENGVPLIADINGVKLVELVATTGSPTTFADPVVWGDAALRR